MDKVVVVHSRTRYVVVVDTKSSPVMRLNVIECGFTDSIRMAGQTLLNAVCSTRRSTCPLHALARTNNGGCAVEASDGLKSSDTTA